MPVSYQYAKTRRCRGVCGMPLPNTVEFFPNTGLKYRDGTPRLGSYCHDCRQLMQTAVNQGEAVSFTEIVDDETPTLIHLDRTVERMIIIDEAANCVKEVEVKHSMSLDRWRAMGEEARRKITKGTPIGLMKRRNAS